MSPHKKGRVMHNSPLKKLLKNHRTLFPLVLLCSWAAFLNIPILFHLNTEAHSIKEKLCLQ